MSITPSHLKIINRKYRFGTIGTSDTYDVNQNENCPGNDNQIRNATTKKSLCKGRNQSKGGESKRHNKSLSSVFMQSRYRDSTPKMKIKRLMSITQNDSKALRVKTDYSETAHPYTFKKIVSELKKNVPSHSCQYRLDSFKVLKMIHQTERQQFFTVKLTSSQGQQKKFTLIKLKQGKVKPWQKESKIYSQISRELNKKQRKLFVKIHHIWKQKKLWWVLIDNYLNPSEFDGQFYLFLNLFKNNFQIINFFIQQLATNIFFLSKTGRAHTNLTLASVYFPVFKGFPKADGLIKIGHLRGCVNMNHKQELLKMPIGFHTPPEVLNFILFEQGQPFDRQYLQRISELREGWQVDVWSLGIMVLQLLNGGPLAGSDRDCYSLISLQHQLLIRYSYLFQKLPHNTHLCLSKMLTFNPQSRPHPLELLELLGQIQN